uniref:HMG box domain-containing protein n=2 Tax=Amphora coffeiformis TaxID=265554 RepID=A0A7S3L4J3_9STRA
MYRSANFQRVLPRLHPSVGLGPDDSSVSVTETAPRADFNSATSLLASSPTVLLSPATKPKRPLSAYNLFFQFERKKILESATPGAPELGFKDMARAIARRWKNVDSNYKMELISMANENKMRYNMAVRSYRKQLDDEVEHLQQQQQEEEVEQAGGPPRDMMPATSNNNRVRCDVAMRTYRKQLADEAMSQHQQHFVQAKSFTLISQVTPLNDKAYNSPVDDMQKEPLLWERMMHTSDTTAPTSILQDSSVASLAQHLDEEMTHTIIRIFS